MKIKTNKRENGFSLCNRIEQAIIDTKFVSPLSPEAAPIILAMAFPFQAGRPSSPWRDLDPSVTDFKDRVITHARLIGIDIEVES